ncbi:RlpA-like double-psi beta-barrel-protein domain-containing protein-containing protein [Zopfochytrium polystomum]|nr:RlpA-like double-psi beta-barrel-protein domain-containing protein-containing protein [Zopfochytrium polystomum]
MALQTGPAPNAERPQRLPLAALLLPVLLLAAQQAYAQLPVGHVFTEGIITYYGDGGSDPPPIAPTYGACGYTSAKDPHYFAALYQPTFNAYMPSWPSKVCGQCAKVSCKNAADCPPNSVTHVQIVDSCPGCPPTSDGASLDLSHQAFGDLVGGFDRATSLGRLAVVWEQPHQEQQQEVAAVTTEQPTADPGTAPQDSATSASSDAAAPTPAELVSPRASKGVTTLPTRDTASSADTVETPTPTADSSLSSVASLLTTTDPAQGVPAFVGDAVGYTEGGESATGPPPSSSSIYGSLSSTNIAYSASSRLLARGPWHLVPIVFTLVPLAFVA